MRQIGTLSNEADAGKLADYLLTLGIITRLERQLDGWVIWVRDEEHLSRARQELEDFARNPADSRYQEAQHAAEQLRRQEERRDAEYQKNIVDLRERWNQPPTRRYPLTIALMAVSILVAASSNMGQSLEPVLEHLFVSMWDVKEGSRWAGLPEIRQGQVWRLVTPVVIHFGVVHLLFNMFCLFDLGRMIEVRWGTWRLALLVLVTAVPSNLAQYYVSGPGFGGMSGVLYGLFGVIWMKSRYDPDAGMFLHPNTVLIMVMWLFVCMTGLVGPIANTAHVVGLMMGILIGVAPVVWRRLIGT